ncbi:MAG: hypothetical protein VX549_04340 [Pseudomonadota bacterium]|nr:hypothetical protein [Pseudomonadota bacterium]
MKRGSVWLLVAIGVGLLWWCWPEPQREQVSAPPAVTAAPPSAPVAPPARHPAQQLGGSDPLAENPPAATRGRAAELPDSSTRESLPDAYLQMQQTFARYRLNPELCADWLPQLEDLTRTLTEGSRPWHQSLRRQAECLVMLGRPADAERALHQARARHPDDAALQTTLARVLFLQQDAEGAWLAMAPLLDTVMNADALDLLAQIETLRATDERFQLDPADNRRRLQRAESALRRLVAEQTGEARVRAQLRLAENLSLQGQAQPALAAVQDAQRAYDELQIGGEDVAPMQAALMFALGETHYLAGDVDVGLAYMQQAILSAADAQERQTLEQRLRGIDTRAQQVLGG